jgi:hypothetical protein
MRLAFPTSDYYDGSVAISDIQRHLSQQSLEIYHLAALRIAFAGVPT